ncbi:hypothetical protein ACF0H5_008334 [Mactra antiquata]
MEVIKLNVFKMKGWIYVFYSMVLLTNAYNMRSRQNEFLNCNKSIQSEDFKKNGTILSPLYPNNYPTSIICEYTFRAQGHERIQLKFTEMNLFYSSGDPNDPFECSNDDSIKVIINIGDKEESIGEFCGRKPPPQLMSNGQRMKVIFKSESKDKEGTSKFAMEYSFRTDFGVRSNGNQDKREVCKFMFHSTVVSQGLFTSPNYGGLYPRNTKCEYIFVGRANEVVQIKFPEFEVDGLNPRCEGHTKSDYVSFSNFLYAHDRKMPRYCGHKQSYDPVISDNAFFKVIFESNEQYDATGFKGMYIFQEDEKTPTPPLESTIPEDSSSHVTASVTMVTIILLCNSVIEYLLIH